MGCVLGWAVLLALGWALGWVLGINNLCTHRRILYASIRQRKVWQWDVCWVGRCYWLFGMGVRMGDGY